MNNNKVSILSQYKSDINRLLSNQGKVNHIGYTYARGKSPAIYTAAPDGLILSQTNYRNYNELLTALIATHKTLQFT